ncbi:MAG: hypothetical protein ABSE92_17575 [Terriglobales bacterium]|jgi:hypothetical protein
MANRSARKSVGGRVPEVGGFVVPADFASKATVGMPFDEFVAENVIAGKIMTGLSDPAGLSAKQYFQSGLSISAIESYIGGT